MDWLVAVGALSLGIIIGCLVAYFVEEAPRLNAKVLYTAISIFGGSAVAAIFHLLGGAPTTRELWTYPIGLLFGFVGGSIYEYLYPAR